MNNTMKKSILLFIIFFASALEAQSLRFFEFAFRGMPGEANVIAATSDTDVISLSLAQLALPEAQRNLLINGEIQYGTNTNNPVYSWHFVSNAWVLAEAAIEVCDGKPSDVEVDKEYWIKQVGRFCPWSSYVLKENTPSDVPGDKVSGIVVSPNPASSVLTIKADIAISDIALMDVTGKYVMYPSPYEERVDISKFPAGAYYLIVRHSAGNSICKIAKN